jgi:methionine-rich copper-binding protein CopC
MRRLLGAVAAAGLLWLAVASAASAHSQLVSSSPGAGDVVATAPTEIRLVFSEPLEPKYSSLDLLDPVGATILLGAGTVDPADPRVLVAPVSGLEDGSYTVNWRAVSASDGHSTSGFITFGIGAGSSGGQGTGDAPAGGDLHAGHSGAAAIAEVEGKTVGYGGLMLVFGIALLLLLFGTVAPAARGIAANAAWILLIAAASGSIVLILVEASSLPAVTGSSSLDVAGYVTNSRVGQLLALRTLVALVGAAIVFVLATIRRNGAAIAVGAVAAVVGLILVALSGHAAGFESPVPIVVDLVHLGSTSVWLAGVVGLFWLIEFGGLSGDDLRALVPRFSAVALVTVTLIVFTGIYQAWIETYDFTSISTPYSLTLAAKVMVFFIALVFGAVNYFDGGRNRRWLGGFRSRIFLEAGFAVAVVGLAANVTSGSPTSEGIPIQIAQAVSTAAPGSVDASLGVQPGRAGPNRYVVELSSPPPDGSIVQLDLQRLDSSIGESRITMRPSGSGPAGQVFIADGGQMAVDSRWDASVIVLDGAGVELGRRRFEFAIGADGITEGRALPPIDPALLAGVALLGLGIAAVAFGLAGGRLPRTAAGASRAAMVGGGVVGGIVGAVILSGGPR